jgi:hypothetical protein
MINPDGLTPEHKERLVVYTPHEGARPEQGRITSWNERFIFVDYDNTGRGQATPPSKLDFIYG